MPSPPVATYALRDFAQAGELAGYLAALGISHVATAPPRADLDREAVARLRAHGLGIVLDVEPEEDDRTPWRPLGGGLVDGLRVADPDRLADPRAYLRGLARGRTWLVVRKILAEGEEFPPDWPCAGTTGHDALGMAGGVFVDPAGEKPLTEAYTHLTGGPEDFTEVERAAKHLVADRLPEPAGTLARILPDADPDALRDVVAALLVAMPVRRAYVVPGEEPPAASLEAVAQAAAEARAALPPGDLLDRVVPLVLGLGGRDPLRDAFAVRFQQASAALGAEEIAFHRWSRFAALNEIGCDPMRFGVSPAEFHAHGERTARDRPRTLTTLSAHDTMWQEDLRARLAVLSELPDEWTAAVGRWRSRAPEGPLDPDLDYLMWQVIVGAWPLSADRLGAFLAQAARCARAGVADEAVRGHAGAVLSDATLTGEIAEFVVHLAPLARVNSLGQKLVQLTMPGVPEVYQGCELTGFALAAPDNRRPVDYARRRELLADLVAGTVPEGLDGEKLLITSRALRLRGEHPRWFSGAYEPLSAVGPAAQHVLAYRRGGAAIVVTRLPAGLGRGGGWGTTYLRLPGGPWRDLLTGRSYGPVVALSGLLSLLPVAVLTEAV